MEIDEPKFWIFQFNPEEFDIEKAIDKLDKDVFTVNQYKKQIKKGDKILFWVSGKKAGIIGYGEVLTNPKVIDQNPESVQFVKKKNSVKKSISVWVSYNKIKEKILNVDLQKDYFYITKDMRIFKNSWSLILPIKKEIWDFFNKKFISKLTITFSRAEEKKLYYESTILKSPDIYDGEEKIPFKKKDLKFKRILMNEFSSEKKDSNNTNNEK